MGDDSHSLLSCWVDSVGDDSHSLLSCWVDSVGDDSHSLLSCWVDSVGDDSHSLLSCWVDSVGDDSHSLLSCWVDSAHRGRIPRKKYGKGTTAEVTMGNVRIRQTAKLGHPCIVGAVYTNFIEPVYLEEICSDDNPWSPLPGGLLEILWGAGSLTSDLPLQNHPPSSKLRSLAEDQGVNSLY